MVWDVLLQGKSLTGRKLSFSSMGCTKTTQKEGWQLRQGHFLLSGGGLFNACSQGSKFQLFSPSPAKQSLFLLWSEAEYIPINTCHHVFSGSGTKSDVN